MPTGLIDIERDQGFQSTIAHCYTLEVEQLRANKNKQGHYILFGFNAQPQGENLSNSGINQHEQHETFSSETTSHVSNI